LGSILQTRHLAKKTFVNSFRIEPETSRSLKWGLGFDPSNTTSRKKHFVNSFLNRTRDLTFFKVTSQKIILGSVMHKNPKHQTIFYVLCCSLMTDFYLECACAPEHFLDGTWPFAAFSVGSLLHDLLILEVCIWCGLLTPHTTVSIQNTIIFKVPKTWWWTDHIHWFSISN